ncbi:hypothetical protein [Aquibacillus sediminis]|uniref:hypothetical protein n=1 Tax=Aquibacillus sediminis TaxID=2574734 RepID=UPI001FE46BB3|nr:hypothetical protein [Aquibacillus sediminis]
MDKQIFKLLTEMNKEIKSMNADIGELKTGMKTTTAAIGELKTGMKTTTTDISELKTGMKTTTAAIGELKTDMKNTTTDIHDFKSEMHERFNAMEAKLQGVGEQFELTNESRITDVGFIADKVNRLERELYIIKNKNMD